MEDVFKSINMVTRTEGQMKAYDEPMYDSVSHEATERINEVSHSKYSKVRTPSKTYNSPHFSPHKSSHFRSPHNFNSHWSNSNQRRSQYNCSQNNLKCYHCKGKHYIRDHDKFTQDKAKYKLKTSDIVQKYKDKIIQKAKKDNVSISEATFSTSQESTYSMEQAKQL